MASYRLGSAGEEVSEIQTRLAKLGYYQGPIDGAFGGGTQAAAKSFQKDEGLDVDGVVGPNTWKALFNRKVPEPASAGESLNYRCLAMTGSFETGTGIPDCFAGLSGDFDGQGISFGVLQWNVGQKSLQPLFAKMLATHHDVVESIFHEHTPVLDAMLQAPWEEQMEFSRRIQHPVKHTINEPWRGLLKSLARTPEFQQIEADAASRVFAAARKDCTVYGLKSERGVALLFDIRVQNGSIGAVTRAQILADFAGIDDDLAPQEQEVTRLRIIANRRAEAAKAQWIEDVRARKLCIANGEGMVHGVHYDLAEQFGLSMARAR